jgi:NADH-quinone oxidoreductase subunit G
MFALAVRQAARQRSLEHAASQRIPLWDDAAVRNASQGAQGRLSIAAPYATKLDDIAGHTYHGAPDDLARFGLAIAHELNPGIPAVEHLREGLRTRAALIAAELRNAKRPLVVSGTGCSSRAVIEAAANIAWALCVGDRQASLGFVVPECNTLGLGLLGSSDLETAVQAVQEGKADTVIVAENDLYTRLERTAVDEFLARVRHLIVIDHIETRTASRAEVTLPAATFAESDGDLVNNEGRAQRFYQVFVPEGGIQETWRWLRDIITASGGSGGRSWEGLDDVITSLATTLPEFSAIPDIAPPAGFRIAGMRIARQPHRYSGRTAMFANRTVFEPRPSRDPDSPLTFSMEGFPGQPPSPLITHFWYPAWNSPQAINKFQAEVGGPLRGGDPGKRLIEPSSSAPRFFQEVPAAFAPGKDTWLLVPFQQIFGSEQLSSLAPGIAERAPGPFVGLNPDRARDLAIAEGEEVQVQVANVTLTAPVRYVRGLPEGVACLPAGLADMPVMALPAPGRIIRSGGRP